VAERHPAVAEAAVIGPSDANGRGPVPTVRAKGMSVDAET